MRNQATGSTSQVGGLGAAPAWADGLSRRPAGPSSFRALVVEDNQADVSLFEKVLAAMPGMRLQVARTGGEALALIERIGQPGAPAPDLVFLDLNLPGAHGHEILRALRGRWQTRLVPVVVMSGSTRPADVRESYLSQANLYITKPQDVAEYMDTIENLCLFWREVASIPKRSDAALV